MTDELARLLGEWADDFEAAANIANGAPIQPRFAATILMTRAKECRDQLVALRDVPAPKADAEKVDRCPTCRSGWTLFKPAKCHGSDHVRCIECKAVYPLSIVAASALPALTDPQGREG